MKDAIVQAVRRMSILKYFPSDEVARVEIMRLLDRLVSTPEQLDWLVNALIDEVGEWPGPKEVRGIFCTRFPPKDGVETDAEHSKFSPIAMEARQLLAEPPKVDRKLLGPAAEEVSADSDCRELVVTSVGKLPAIVVRESDKRAAREWAEKLGLA